MKFFQLDAVNAGWKVHRTKSNDSGFMLFWWFWCSRKQGFATASANQLSCLEEPGLQQSVLFNKAVSVLDPKVWLARNANSIIQASPVKVKSDPGKMLSSRSGSGCFMQPKLIFTLLLSC